MPNTPQGFPYPVSTDPLAGGAAAIEALARALDANLTSYRKTTAKQVINTVTETDLLNGEITLAAGVLGTNRVARITAGGDLRNFSASNLAPPRFKLKLGATVLIDTGVTPGFWGTTDTGRRAWNLDATIAELGAAAQSIWLRMNLSLDTVSGATPVAFTTGQGIYGAIQTGSLGLWQAIGGATAALASSAALPLVLSVILPVANANVDVTLTRALVEII